MGRASEITKALRGAAGELPVYGWDSFRSFWGHHGLLSLFRGTTHSGLALPTGARLVSRLSLVWAYCYLCPFAF